VVTAVNPAPETVTDPVGVPDAPVTFTVNLRELVVEIVEALGVIASCAFAEPTLTCELPLPETYIRSPE